MRWGLRPQTPKTAPHCEFLATRLEECWKKKKEQEGVGHNTIPPQEDTKQSERWDFAVSDLKKKWKKKGEDKKDVKSRLRVCIIRFC